MKCADSSILYYLIGTYPKVLYTIRAFTHALAYFNSCLNPYLYALVNRNFCFDFIDIIPRCFTCWKRPILLQNESFHPNTKVLSSAIISNENLLKKRPHNYDDDDDEDEIYYLEKTKQRNIDASCQVELLRT